MRLTSKRCNGIKQGYWSPSKKEDLCQKLGMYEDIGAPEELKKVVHAHWVPKETIVRTPFARNYYCSNCYHEPLESANFCPECGAIMDEET